MFTGGQSEKGQVILHQKGTLSIVIVFSEKNQNCFKKCEEKLVT